MPYPASSYPEGVDLTIIAGNQLHQVINGEANEVVSTTSGDIPSVRKALADSMMFKVPVDWVQGEVTTDPLETRLYNGQPYWAPEATLANPITLGSSPVATTDWLLAPQGYRNEYNLGKYQAGILISDSQEYVVYSGKSYFAVSPPYTTTSTTPDNDTNMFEGGYTTIKSSAEVFSNTNLLSNSNFLTPSPDAITHPNATPESYVAGTQIFSGVYAGDSGCTITFIGGRVNCTAGDYQFKLPNTGGLERVPVFTSSVSDYDGIPKTTGVSHALVGDEYVVTVTSAAGDVFSVKLEQGGVATRHEFKSLFDIYGHPSVTGFANIRAYGAIGDGFSDDSQAIISADNSGYPVYVPSGTYRFSQSASLTSDFTFNGGVISVDQSEVITWAGDIIAGDFKIFDGNVEISKVHRLSEIRITWFGAKSSDLDSDMGDTTLANSNAKAIREACNMATLGVPNGIYVTPAVIIPTGLFLVDDDDDDGVIFPVAPYFTLMGYGWSSVIRPVNGAKNFSVIKCNTDSASNIIIDKLHVYGEASLQTNTQHGLDISPPTSPVIYSYVGRNFHTKEMSGNGIRITGAGMDNSTIEPRLVRDSSQHNLLVTACDRLTVQGGVYRTAKSGASGAVFDGPGCLSAIIRDNQFDENDQNGLIVSNVSGRFDVSNNRCASNVNGNGMTIDRVDNSQVSDNQCELNGNDGMLIDNCDGTAFEINQIRSNQRYGIIAASVTNCKISNSYASNNSLSAPGIYDGINLQSNSDYNSLQSNMVRGTSHRHGINIQSADCDGNSVLSNDLVNSGSTSPFNNVGTNTVDLNSNAL